MNISKRIISNTNKPFIIAEISGNHDGSFLKAKKLIDAAKWAGVDAVKLQTFKPELMTLNSTKKNFIVSHKNYKWSKKTLFSLFKKSYTPWEWYPKLQKHCKEKKIILFSSVFDLKSLEFLENLNFPAYKIASFENNDFNLIKEISKKKKPIIMSTGMAKLDEIIKGFNIIKKYLSVENIALLKCTSSYPAQLNESDLNTIVDMKKRFKCQIGLSDHTMGTLAPVAAVSLGATIIEKHICLDKKTGIDSFFSATPKEMKKLVNETKNCWESLGKIFYGPSKSERKSVKNRRSLFTLKNIKKNEKFTWKNVISLRPVIGIDSQFCNKVINKISKKNITKDQAIKWNMIKK
jgi:pseudaminic acid synthase